MRSNFKYYICLFFKTIFLSLVSGKVQLVDPKLVYFLCRCLNPKLHLVLLNVRTTIVYLLIDYSLYTIPTSTPYCILVFTLKVKNKFLAPQFFSILHMQMCGRSDRSNRSNLCINMHNTKTGILLLTTHLHWSHKSTHLIYSVAHCTLCAVNSFMCVLRFPRKSCAPATDFYWYRLCALRQSSSSSIGESNGRGTTPTLDWWLKTELLWL